MFFKLQGGTLTKRFVIPRNVQFQSYLSMAEAHELLSMENTYSFCIPAEIKSSLIRSKNTEYIITLVTRGNTRYSRNILFIYQYIKIDLKSES